MKTRKSFIFLVVLSALLLQACGASKADIATEVAQALYISRLETEAAAAGGQAQPPAQNGGGQPATPSYTPTITLTPTPSIPYISVSQDTNCRSGPQIDYSYIIQFHPDQRMEVLKLFSTDYVVVRNPNGGDCWLWLRYANTTDFSAFNLPFATQPPTPVPPATATPEYIWDGSWTTWIGLEALTACTMTLTRSGNSLSGTYDCGSGPGTIDGTLSSDLRTVTGFFQMGMVAGSFTWVRKTNNINQFVGHQGSKGWCGARAGASQPSPCFGP